MSLLRAFRRWQMRRALDRALALRKADRRWRSQAALKGHQTRKAGHE